MTRLRQLEIESVANREKLAQQAAKLAVLEEKTRPLLLAECLPIWHRKFCKLTIHLRNSKVQQKSITAA